MQNQYCFNGFENLQTNQYLKLSSNSAHAKFATLKLNREPMLIKVMTSADADLLHHDVYILKRLQSYLHFPVMELKWFFKYHVFQNTDTGKSNVSLKAITNAKLYPAVVLHRYREAISLEEMLNNDVFLVETQFKQFIDSYLALNQLTRFLHNDLHSYNILYDTSRFVMIDYGASYVDLQEDDINLRKNIYTCFNGNYLDKDTTYDKNIRLWYHTPEKWYKSRLACKIGKSQNWNRLAAYLELGGLLIRAFIEYDLYAHEIYDVFHDEIANILKDTFKDDPDIQRQACNDLSQYDFIVTMSDTNVVKAINTVLKYYVILKDTHNYDLLLFGTDSKNSMLYDSGVCWTRWFTKLDDYRLRNQNGGLSYAKRAEMPNLINNNSSNKKPSRKVARKDDQESLVYADTVDTNEKYVIPNKSSRQKENRNVDLEVDDEFDKWDVWANKASGMKCCLQSISSGGQVAPVYKKTSTVAMLGNLKRIVYTCKGSRAKYVKYKGEFRKLSELKSLLKKNKS